MSNAPQAARSAQESASSPARHLRPVDPLGTPIEWTREEFIPVYVREFMSRRGYDSDATLFFAAIVKYQGIPADGRRQTRDELSRAETFSARAVTSNDLRRLFGWTRDRIQKVGGELAGPRPCPRCSWAHPVLRIYQRVGRGHTYDIVRCSEVQDSERIRIDELPVKPKRVKTGGKPIAPTAQLDLLPPAVDGKPAAAPVEPTSRPAGRSTGRRGGAPPAPELRIDPALGAQLVANVVEHHAVSLDDASVAAVAELSASLLAQVESRVLRVIAYASLHKKAVTPDVVAEALSGYDDALETGHNADPEPSDNVGGSTLNSVREPSENVGGSPATTSADRPATTAGADADWIAKKLLDLGRRKEPWTTLDHAVRHRRTLLALCVKEHPDDLDAALRALESAVTDPRVAGAVNPIAFLRLGLAPPDSKDPRKHCLYTPADRDDGSNRLAVVYKRIPLGKRQAIEHEIRDHRAGGSLNHAMLRELGVYSDDMLRYLIATLPP